MTFSSIVKTQGRFFLAGTLVGTAGIWMAIPWPNQPAVANDVLVSTNTEAFKESNAINGILCIAACNEFFEAGQASFELEIRNLQSRAASTENEPAVLQVDPDLIENLEEQRESESLQNM